jgi:hypothetical protein
MTPDEEAQFGGALREAIRKSRGYADFFGWGPNRDFEELGVLTSLAESMQVDGKLFFGNISVRGRGSDPPDLEALDSEKRRVAFEITELVDGDAIRAYKAGRPYEWAQWPQAKFLSTIGALLKIKNDKFEKLKGQPYPGGYVVVIFTDEPELQQVTVDAYLQNQSFSGIEKISRAFLVLSYSPALSRCPYYELATVA